MNQESMTASELDALLASGRRVAILDVREPDEFAAWRMPGAVNVPLDVLERSVVRPPTSGAVVAVVCATGPRSVAAAARLRERGVPARFVEGGMVAWNGVYRHEEVPRVEGDDTRVVQLQRVGKGCLTYVIANGGEALVVDPTLDVGEPIAAAAALGARIVAVADTHAHADHASGARRLAEITGARYHAPDEVGERVPHEPLRDIKLGGTVVRALTTPGHTATSTTLLVGDVALTGDTLFVESAGRPDLGQEPEPHARLLWRSLRERVMALPPGTRVLPGHFGDDARPAPGALVMARLDALRARLPALAMDEPAFVRWAVGDALPKPANFERIKAMNTGRAPVPARGEARALEAGPNLCAVSPAPRPVVGAVSDVAPREAARLLAAGDAMLVDVRERYEWAEARIPGARLVPLGDIERELHELPRDRTIIVQCHSGNRSRRAAATLVAAGFPRVANLAGGISRWAREGLDVEAGP